MKSYKIVPQTFNFKGINNGNRMLRTSEIVHKYDTHCTCDNSAVCNCSRRVGNDNVINCMVISDGENSISVKELVDKYKQKIDLIPLSLVINENVTEYIRAPDNQAYNCVSVKVDVPEEITSFIPTKCVIYNKGKSEIFLFRKSENIIRANDNKHNYLILCYSYDAEKNALEFASLKAGERVSKLSNKMGILISKASIMSVESVEIYGVYDSKESLIIKLEGDPFKQNLKLYISKGIK